MMILCTDIITKEKSLIINNIGEMINKKKVWSTQIVYKHYISAVFIVSNLLTTKRSR